MFRFRPRYLKDYIWQSKARNALRWVIEIIIAVALGIFVAYFFCQRVVVPDDSMQPGLAAGDKVLLNKLTYSFTDPQRGDVIAFRSGDDENAAIRIKRIIGLPGETITIRNGQVIINGEVYVENNDFPSIVNAGLAEDEITLGGTEYFVLGDSRNDSEDSRHVDVGNVDSDLIIGKLWLTYSPLGSFGLVE